MGGTENEEEDATYLFRLLVTPTPQGLSIAFSHPTPLLLPRSGNFLSKATNPLGRA